MEQQAWAETLCREAGLGTLLRLSPVSGGYLHRMLRLDTDSGSYALKLLNPLILLRPEAPGNFDRAERLERLLEERGLPIVPALEWEGKKRHELLGRTFYLFPWVEGAALKPAQVTKAHCQIVGGLLAQIHGMERREGIAFVPSPPICWETYPALLEERCPRLSEPLTARLPMLTRLTQAAQDAAPRVPAVESVCNGDMDCKNILWEGLSPHIIDLECLSLDNPYPSLLALAMDWSGEELLTAFLSSYRENGGVLPTDWAALYDADTGMLEWLEYNLKRAAGLESGDEEERRLGISQAEDTLCQLEQRCQRREKILSCLGTL